MIDHASISVSDYEKSMAFYDKSLALIGYTRVMAIDQEKAKCAGYGQGNKPHFWISPQGKTDEHLGQARGVHFAFLAPTQSAVDAWHQQCLALGGTDNGKPGLRPYHPGYYGAFIIDPDGWRIEACHRDQ
jgi:catechol 2,3-dioxygenase-like lactoylglutathione lyase family enzyme